MFEKTVGITADDYKVETFKKSLTSAGFIDFTISPFTINTKLIKVTIKSPNEKTILAEVIRLGKLCERVQKMTKNSN